MWLIYISHCINLVVYNQMYLILIQFSSVESLSRVLFVTPWTAACQASCPSPTPGACSNSCPWSWWCHPTISSSVVPFSSCLQSFPASGSFPMSHFFASGGPSIGASASTSVLPMNIQDWFPSGLTGLISLLLVLIIFYKSIEEIWVRKCNNTMKISR